MAFLRGGLHPALALVPIVPFIPHGVGAEPGLGLGSGHEPRSDIAKTNW